MEEVHQHLSPALALEERVAWNIVSGNLDEVNLEIARAVKALAEGDRRGLLAWASQAVGRLPPAVFGTEAGQALRFVATQATTGSGKLAATAESDPAVLLADLPVARLGVRRSGGWLELGNLTPRTRKVLPLPDTDPRLVEVIWNENSMERTARVPVVAGRMERVAVGIYAARLRNAWRQEFQAPPFGFWSGPPANWFTFQSNTDAGGHTVFSLNDGTSDTFREEFSLPPEQFRLLMNFLRERLQLGQLDSSTGATLTEMMPFDEWTFLRKKQIDSTDFLLLLDSGTDLIPWEMIRLSASDEDSALGLTGRLVRRSVSGQWEKDRFSPKILVNESPNMQSMSAKTLVLTFAGSTPGPWIAALRQEAEQVLQLMAGAGFPNADGFEGAPKDSLNKLYSQPVRVLHLAGPLAASLQEDSSSGASQSKVFSKTFETNGFPAWPAGERRAGIDLGDGLLLTPEEIRQMRVLPELVVLHAVPGDKGGNRQPALLTPAFAAEWGRALEQVGVKAILVNGWTVEPEPASLFVLAFYSALLAGSTLAEAGLLARQETRRVYSQSTAWAAFQVHGDPDFTLPFPAATTPGFQEAEESSPPPNRRCSSSARWRGGWCQNPGFIACP